MSDDSPNYGMPVHPVCDMFPLIGGEGFLGLCSDIRAQGLLHPVVVHEGQIVDGRNRILACEDIGVKPRFVEWRAIYQGPMALSRWIWSVNVERRHLTVDQILAIEVTLHAWEELESARQRQMEGGKRGGKLAGRGRPKRACDQSVTSLIPTSPSTGAAAGNHTKGTSGRTRARIAARLGVSERKVGQALTIQKAAPELLKDVASGATTMLEAEKQVNAKTAPQVSLGFDVPRAIEQILRRVDGALKACPGNQRAAFLSGLRKAIGEMR